MSARCVGVRVTERALFAGFGSVTPSAAIVAALVVVTAETTVTVMDSVAELPGAPAGSVPTVQIPVDELYVPRLGLADTKAVLAGSRSVTVTLLAVAGPLLVAVMVKVTGSPTDGVALLAVWATARSASVGGGVPTTMTCRPSARNARNTIWPKALRPPKRRSVTLEPSSGSPIWITMLPVGL